ncbi:RHOMBOID-like protein 12 [Perilla frutescens var. frutescens]|nr:RHOMBOID-like protein 12 [Perilla frutescens var. frutescens]
MRKPFCVELFSKITRNGYSATYANLFSPKSAFSSAIPKSTSNPFHQRYLSHYSTISRSHLWNLCTPNAVTGTMRNGGFRSFVLARMFFSNALLKGQGKFPATIRTRRFLHSFQSMDRGRRSVFRRFTVDGVVIGLITANVAVFILWKVADPTFMMKNFMISVDSFTSGRLHTLITNAFSHRDAFHLFGNMMGLYFFGTSIGRNFGPEYLLKLYLSGAIAGSIFYLAYHAFIAPSLQKEQMRGISSSKIPGLGASGAVNAIMLLDIFLFPRNIVYFEMFIPMPAILVGIFIIGHDIWRAWQGETRVSGSAHLGGATVAALAWLQNRKGRFRRF